MDTFAELQRQSAYSSLWVNPLVAVTICEDDKRTEDEMMDLLLQMLEAADMQLKDALATIKKQYIHGNCFFLSFFIYFFPVAQKR